VLRTGDRYVPSVLLQLVFAADLDGDADFDAAFDGDADGEADFDGAFEPEAESDGAGLTAPSPFAADTAPTVSLAACPASLPRVSTLGALSPARPAPL
jgi:hypothetical protein